MLERLGVDRERAAVVVRTAPSYALYLRGSENELLTRLLTRLNEQPDAQTVVLDAHRRAAPGARAPRGLERLIVPERAVDGRSLVAFADLLVSAGGTMNREAAVLGTPVWSIFEGKPGAVDEMLQREGRLQIAARPVGARAGAQARGRVAAAGAARPGGAAAAGVCPESWTAAG